MTAYGSSDICLQPESGTDHPGRIRNAASVHIKEPVAVNDRRAVRTVSRRTQPPERIIVVDPIDQNSFLFREIRRCAGPVFYRRKIAGHFLNAQKKYAVLSVSSPVCSGFRIRQGFVCDMIDQIPFRIGKCGFYEFPVQPLTQPTLFPGDFLKG